MDGQTNKERNKKRQTDRQTSKMQYSTVIDMSNVIFPLNVKLTIGGANVILNSISAEGESVPFGGCTLNTESTSGTRSSLLASSVMSGLYMFHWNGKDT